MSQNNSNKMTELMLEYNLTQLVSDPTHYTESSSSLIDLILVRNCSYILFSGVADPFFTWSYQISLSNCSLTQILTPTDQEI